MIESMTYAQLRCWNKKERDAGFTFNKGQLFCQMYFAICIKLHIKMCKLISELGNLKPGRLIICICIGIFLNARDIRTWCLIRRFYLHPCRIILH